MRIVPVVLLSSVVMVSTSFHASPVRAAAQSDCQTEDCKRARNNQEHRCKDSPPVSMLPAGHVVRIG